MESQFPRIGIRCSGAQIREYLLFVQGAGERAHDQWDNKLVQSLERELRPGYSIRFPRMPDEDDPRYSAWKATLLNEFKSLEDGAVLVGHSVGATLLLYLLAEEPLELKPGALFLIAAPFIGNGGWPSDDIQPRRDVGERLTAGVPVFLYHGTEDQMVPFGHLQFYAKVIPQAVVRALPNRNPQLDNDLSEVARDKPSDAVTSYI